MYNFCKRWTSFFPMEVSFCFSFFNKRYMDFLLSAAQPTDQGEESVVLLLVVVGGGIFKCPMYSFGVNFFFFFSQKVFLFSHPFSKEYLRCEKQNFFSFFQKVFPFSHPFSKKFPWGAIWDVRSKNFFLFFSKSLSLFTPICCVGITTRTVANAAD